jgi:hypothetical protein
MYWKELWGFIGRNSLTIALMAVIAVTWPWTLWIIIPIALGVLRFQMAIWKVRRAFQDHSNAFRNANNTKKENTQKSGNIKITLTDQVEQRISNDVGEYVDFQEIKDDKK